MFLIWICKRYAHHVGKDGDNAAQGLEEPLENLVEVVNILAILHLDKQNTRSFLAWIEPHWALINRLNKFLIWFRGRDF